MKKLLPAILIIGIILVLVGRSAPSTADIPLAQETPSASEIVQTPAPEPSTTPTPAPTAPPSPTSVPEATLPPVTEASTFQVDFINVGQADSVLIESNGSYALIDGGNVEDSSRIYTYLKDRGITHLEYIFGTHPHEDHIGGLSGALSLVSAGKVFSPVLTYDSDAFRDFATKAEPYGGLTIPTVGDKLLLGNSLIEVLGLNAGSEINDSSIILKLSYGNTSFLFTGDAEDAAEKAIIGKDLSATVLKVGHHGSETSTSYQFLREVMPKYAVLSVGQDNSYGHPDNAVMSRLRDANAAVFRTDTQGDIVCKSDGNDVIIIPEKNADAQTNPTAQVAAAEESIEAAPAPVEEPAPAPATGQYIGNVNSYKFHRPSCGTLPKESNRVYFSSRDEAINAGMVPCKRCDP